MKNFRRRPAGFTLTEVLIAVTLTLILLGLMIRVFAISGSEIAKGRALLEMAGQLRATSEMLRRDLAGATKVMLPQSQQGDGYFEYIEGIAKDRFVHTFKRPDPISNQPLPDTSTIYGDVDDILMFTAHSMDQPYRGRFRGQIIESNYAEIIWWTVFEDENGNGQFNVGEELKLYRRVLLIRPDLTTTETNVGEFLQFNDVSVRLNPDNRISMNQLSDLSDRANRFARAGIAFQRQPNSFEEPSYADLQGTNAFVLTNPTAAGTPNLNAGEDVILSGITSFDIQVFDPLVEIRPAFRSNTNPGTGNGGNGNGGDGNGGNGGNGNNGNGGNGGNGNNGNGGNGNNGNGGNGGNGNNGNGGNGGNGNNGNGGNGGNGNNGNGGNGNNGNGGNGNGNKMTRGNRPMDLGRDGLGYQNNGNGNNGNGGNGNNGNGGNGNNGNGGNGNNGNGGNGNNGNGGNGNNGNGGNGNNGNGGNGNNGNGGNGNNGNGGNGNNGNGPSGTVGLSPGDFGYQFGDNLNVQYGGYVDLNIGQGNGLFTGPPRRPIPGGRTLNWTNPTFCTWSLQYEADGIDQDSDGVVDEGTNQLDDNAQNGADDVTEYETRPPYPYPLRGIKITIRMLEQTTQVVRQTSVIKDFVPE